MLNFHPCECNVDKRKYNADTLLSRFFVIYVFLFDIKMS